MDRHRAALTAAALLAIPLAFLAIWFAWPLVAIVDQGIRPDGSLDLGPLADVVGDRHLRSVVGFTIGQAVLSTLLTVALGLPCAYVLSRFAFRGRQLLNALVLIPFVLPTVVVGLAFARGEGSLAALVVAHAFFNLAVVVRVVGTAWSGVDPDLEDAAEGLGAHGWRRFPAVLWPAGRSAIAGAATLVFLFSLTSFGAALLLAPPGAATIEVEIWRRTTQFLDLPVAAALALVQLAVVAGLLVLDAAIASRAALQRTLGATTRHARTTGERTLQAVVVGFVLLFTVGPILRVVARSLGGPDGLTLDRYLDLGSTRRGGIFDVVPSHAIATSLRTAVVAAAIALVVGLLAAFALARSRRSSAWPLLGMPLGASAVTLGLGYVLAFRDPPLDLRGSPLIVPLAQAVVAIPFVIRIAAPAITAAQRSLGDQAADLGASPWQATRDVVLRVTAPALATAAAFAFSISLGEFGATSFLARADAPTMPVAIVRLLSQPGAASVGQAYAMATLLMLVTVGAVATLGAAGDRLVERRQRSGPIPQVRTRP
jgi:thiamine transport system permease protein